MKQVNKIQSVSAFVLCMSLSFPLYAQSDDRPVEVTGTTMVTQRVEGSAELRTDPRRGDLEGVVISVNPNGDDFIMRTNGEEVFVDAKGGVKVWYQGQSYRVRDLERGDVVDVHLYSTSNRYRFRARAVDVIRSVSHDRYDNDRYGRDRGQYDRYDDRREDDWRRRETPRLVSFDGRVVSMNKRADWMTVRTARGIETGVDLSRLRNRSYRSLRVGDRLVVTGFTQGRSFIATDLDFGRGR